MTDSELGACIEASACEELYERVDGVQLFCTCEILAGGDCTDEELERCASACSSGMDSSYFQCMAPYYVDTDDIDVFAAEAKLPQLRVDMLALQ